SAAYPAIPDSHDPIGIVLHSAPRAGGGSALRVDVYWPDGRDGRWLDKRDDLAWLPEFPVIVHLPPNGRSACSEMMEARMHGHLHRIEAREGVRSVRSANESQDRSR
ncbi:MAG: hypothetical protein R3323_06310, partial [Wenzhouxiangellaceae bacterium]|nr:hypothetical protein [Wenzhouxiangellaceae bacterium]